MHTTSDSGHHCNCCGCQSRHDTISVLEESEQFDVHLCGACGHGVRASPVSPDDNIEIQKDVFNATVQPSRPVRWPNRPTLVANEARKLLVPSARKILDIGCGTGNWLSCFDNSWEKYGVDVATTAAEITRRMTGASVFCGPIEKYVDAPTDFDLITAFALIEHLTAPDALLRWCHSHLKPNGLMILMTGDRQSRTGLEFGPLWPMYRPREHVQFFSAQSLCSLAARHGFQVVRREWRASFYPKPEQRAPIRVHQMIAKLGEIAGIIQDGRHDRLYIYARRSISCS